MNNALISYPFPLRGPDAPLVRLFLPSNLTMDEVARLTAFLKTLVEEESRETRMAKSMQNVYRQAEKP